MKWTITPLCMGFLEMSLAVELLHKGYDQKISAPCISWLLQSGDNIMLVDTGPSTPEWSLAYHRPLRRTSEQYLKKSLQNRGIDPKRIKDVILTHLHWDHCSGCNDVPNAKIYVQREELRYAICPYPCDYGSYETKQHLLLASFYNRIHPVQGDLEICPGITLLFTPGHSPGSQSVLVDTEDGPVIIAGDLVGRYEALNVDPPHLPGLANNIEACYSSLERITRITRNILPSHDEQVLQKKQCNERP